MSLTIRSSIMSASTLLRQCRRHPPIDPRRSITTYSQLPQEHQMVYDMCRKLADEVIAPNAKQWDKEHSFPTAAIHQLVRSVGHRMHNHVAYISTRLKCAHPLSLSLLLLLLLLLSLSTLCKF
jgi:hypothetical protein